MAKDRDVMYVGALICCILVLKEVLANFDEHTQLRKTPDSDIYSTLVFYSEDASLVCPFTMNLKQRQVNSSDEAREERRRLHAASRKGSRKERNNLPLSASFIIFSPSAFGAFGLSGFGLTFKRNLQYSSVSFTAIRTFSLTFHCNAHTIVSTSYPYPNVTAFTTEKNLRNLAVLIVATYFVLKEIASI